MSLSFNPKMLAHDIATGMAYLNPVKLKKYTPEELKTLLSHLTLALRDLRAKQIPQDEIMHVKEKHRQLQHLNQAITVINNHVKRHQIRL